MDVSKELNLFCEGRHPYHPDVLMNGQDGKTDLRLRDIKSYGCFYREGFGSEGEALDSSTSNFSSYGSNSILHT
jgi:hypothetical protein